MIIATALLCGAFESKRPSARRETCDSSEDSLEAARTVMLARVEHAPSLSLEPICGCGVGSLEFAGLHPCCAVVDLSGVRRRRHANQLERLWRLGLRPCHRRWRVAAAAAAAAAASAGCLRGGPSRAGAASTAATCRRAPWRWRWLGGVAAVAAAAFALLLLLLLCLGQPPPFVAAGVAAGASEPPLSFCVFEPAWVTGGSETPQDDEDHDWKSGRRLGEATRPGPRRARSFVDDQAEGSGGEDGDDEEGVANSDDDSFVDDSFVDGDGGQIKDKNGDKSDWRVVWGRAGPTVAACTEQRRAGGNRRRLAVRGEPS